MRRAPDSKGHGLLCIAFRPKEEQSTNVLVGEAAMDVECVEVRRISACLSKLPSVADKVDFPLELDADAPTGKVVSKVHIVGEGGLIFIKKRMRSVTTFADEP